MQSPILSIKKILLSLLILPLLGSVFVLVSPPQSAAAANVDSCAQVVENKTCLKEIKSCKGISEKAMESCVLGIIHKDKYHSVYKLCRDRTNPQKCDSDIKKKCSGKKNTTACKEQAFKDGKYKKKTVKAKVDEEVSLAGTGDKQYQCGGGDDAVETRFDFGCQGEGGAIEDLAYAIIRFLSVGVGLVLTASIIYAGIQYSSSEGSPEATQAAKKRIQNAIIGLIFYLFTFALIHYLVPGGLFHP